MTEERELDWDDNFVDDGKDFLVLKAGEVNFKVKSFEKARHIQKTGTLPDCNKMVISLKIWDIDNNETDVKYNMFLHTKCKNFIAAFFTSIGQHKRGEQCQMNWQKAEGAQGRCKIKIRKYTKDDKSEGEINEVTEFLKPPENLVDTPMEGENDYSNENF